MFRPPFTRGTRARPGLPPTWTLLALALLCACTNTEPGAAGEPCNYDAPNTDGCDARSICMSGTCHLMCSSNADCGGGRCNRYQRIFSGYTFQACENPTGGGYSGGTGSGTGSGSSGGSSSCSTRCQSMCTGANPEQACLYCQAACLCRCANNSTCATQNAQTACRLGTCGC